MTNYFSKNLYKILEIEPTESQELIKSAYRRLARIYHPDVNKNNFEAQEKFKEITEAYEILSNLSKKKSYDNFKGYNQVKPQKNDESVLHNAKKAYKSEETFKKEEKKDDKSNDKNFSGVFNDVLNGILNKEPKKTKGKPQRGKDITTTIKIKQREVIEGTNRTINVLHTEKCHKCEGRKIINGAKCPLCNGKGEVSIHKKLNVKIPQGVKSGHKIKIKGEGNIGQNGGKSGDLILIIEVETSKFFKIENLDVFCEIPISLTEAVLGADISVPTLNGNVTMKIPPMTSSGQKFRLSNQGKLDSKTQKQGNQIVTVLIKLPESFSNEELKLFEKLKDSEKYNLRENLLNDK